MNGYIQDYGFYHRNIRRFILASIVFLSVIAPLQAQHSIINIDSLKLRLRTPSLTDDETWLIYKQIADAYLETDPQKTMEYAWKGIHLAEKRNNEYRVATFFFTLGDAYDHADELDSALYYYEQSCAILQQAEEKGIYNQDDLVVLKIQAITNIGSLNFSFGKYDSALKHYFTALDIAEKMNKPKEVAETCIFMARTYTVMSNIRQGETYYLKSEKIYRELNDSLGLSTAEQGLSGIYIRKEDYPKALEYMEESHRILTALPNVTTDQLMFSYQRLTDVWVRIPDYEKALEYARMTVKYAQLSQTKDNLASALYSLSHCYFKQAKYREAEETAFRALETDTTNVYINSILYQIISMSNVFLKNIPKTLEYFRKTLDARDKYSNQNFQSSISEMEVKYKTEKKEMQIAALEAEKRLIMWLGIAGGGLLLLGVAALFFLWRWTVQKRRLAEQQQELAQTHINQLEQEKQLIATQAVLTGEVQERSRLARDLHDGLGGMLTGIKLNLELMKSNNTPIAEEVNYFNKAMQILNNSMVEMRRVAHHLMPDTLSRHGLKAALSDFLNNIPVVEYAWFGNNDHIDDPKKEIMIYRIIHELVNNALKHAGATKICVNVIHEPDYIAFTVFDNGCGFDPSAEAKGMGLANIRERIAACNGRIDVISTPGEGTEVNVELRTILN